MMKKREIELEPQIDDLRRQQLGVANWPIWEKEASSFPWYYDVPETCVLISGEVTVTPDDGSRPVTLRAGDLAVFPAGLACTWTIRSALRKHYRFG